MKDHEDKFWIGLTDSAEQGRWLWVDRSPLNERFDWCGEKNPTFKIKVSSVYWDNSFWSSSPSLSYWNYNEPDNWREDDCVMMGEKSHGYQKSWSDTSCKVSRRSICEKPAVKWQNKSVCVIFLWDVFIEVMFCCSSVCICEIIKDCFLFFPVFSFKN